MADGTTDDLGTSINLQDAAYVRRIGELTRDDLLLMIADDLEQAVRDIDTLKEQTAKYESLQSLTEQWREKARYCTSHSATASAAIFDLCADQLTDQLDAFRSARETHPQAGENE